MISGAGGDPGLFFTVGLRHADSSDAIARVKKDADDINKHLENGAKKAAQTQMDAAQKRFDDEIQKLIAREQIAKRQAEQDIRNADAVAQAQIKAQREAETAQNRAAREAETAHRRMEVSGKKLERAIDGVRGGVEQVARGFVLLGAAGDEDLEKLIKRFAAVEGGIQIFEGVIRIIRKGEEAWKAYTAAVAAARAAEAARGAVGVASAAGSTGAALAGGGIAGAGAALFGSPLAALAAGALAAAAALKILTDVASGDPTSLTARAGSTIARYRLGDAKGDNWYFRPYAEERETERGVTAAERRLQEAREAQQAETARRQLDSRMQDERDSFQARQNALNAGAGLSGGKYALKMAQANVDSARGRFISGESELNRIKAGGIRPNEDAESTVRDAYQQMKSASEDMLNSQKALGEATKQVNQESIATEKEKLGLYKEQLSTVKQQLESTQQQYASESEKFAKLDPTTRQDTIEAAKVARAGGELDTYQAELLRNFSEFGQQVSATYIAEAKKLGGDFILAPLQAQVESLTAQRKQFEASAEAAAKSVKEAGERNEKQFEQYTKDMAKQFEDITKKLMEANKEALNAMANEIARQSTSKNNQTARAPGGS